MISFQPNPATAALAMLPLSLLALAMFAARAPALKFRILRRPLALLLHSAVFGAGQWACWGAWDTVFQGVFGDSVWSRLACAQVLFLCSVMLVRHSIDSNVYDVENCGVSLAGKHALVTGGSAGIGLETARYLAMLGAEVVIACRNETKGRRVADAINASLAGRKDAGRVVCMVLDLKSLENVRTFVAAYRKVHRTGPHLLINNAGLPPKPGQRSTDGFELGLGVMHFGHFYLTKLLRPGIEAVTGKTREDPARIVTVASAAHGIAKFDSSLIDDKRGEGDLRGEITDGGFAAYGRAKLANVLFARELPQRWAGTHVASHSLHPGAVRSEIWRNKNKIFESFWNFAMLFVFRATDVAAQVIIYLLVDRTSRGPHSIYANCFAEDAQESLAEPALDPLLAARLWDVSERVVADFEASTTDDKKSK